MKTLKDLFLDELADMYDAERRLVKSMPKLIKAASSDELKQAIQAHLRETHDHVQKVEQVFHAFGEKAKGQTCEGTVGLLEEGDELASTFKGTPAADAAIISAAQKVEHYEIASYGCLHEWAQRLGQQDAADILQEILNDEKAADIALSKLARASSNEVAATAADENDEGQAGARSGTERRGAAAIARSRNRTDASS